MLPELLKLQENGQFPDDPVKIEGEQIHSVDSVLTIDISFMTSIVSTYVLTIEDIKEIE